jgi:hypothetical protein
MKNRIIPMLLLATMLTSCYTARVRHYDLPRPTVLIVRDPQDSVILQTRTPEGHIHVKTRNLAPGSTITVGAVTDTLR